MLFDFSRASQQPQTTQSASESAVLPKQKEKVARSNKTESTIWSGRSGGLRIRWTTADLYTESAAGTEKIWAHLVKTGFEDFVAVQKESEEAVPAISCEYERTFTVLSVVGNLLSFVDHYYDYCGGAHPSLETRFTTVDLAKPGDVRYTRAEDTPLMDVDNARPGKIIRLSDYFAEKEILIALLGDPVVKRALASLHASGPRTLAELPELFADNDYELGDSRFELRPDFLTRFVFHHIEGDNVAVRIGLPPHYGANKAMHLNIGLLLPMPVALRRSLDLAEKHIQGFLMKDARRITGDRVTKFSCHLGRTPHSPHDAQAVCRSIAVSLSSQ